MYTENELGKLQKQFNLTYNKLSLLFEKSTKPIIFVPHNVPFDTKLDQINNPKSPRNGQHFGSVIARDLIEKHQPILCVGGHMHEGFGKDKIANTTCINAGFGGDVNTLVEIDVDKQKIIKIDFLGKNKEN
jgi:Icc-related predicted phosphoesterase